MTTVRFNLSSNMICVQTERWLGSSHQTLWKTVNATAFQASTAITLTTDVCIDKHMEIDFL